jgi:hypothetical protein
MTEMQGPFAGMKLNVGGKWSLADGVVSYTTSGDSGKAKVAIASGRLTFDPDFVLRKDGTVPISGEYRK